MLEELENGKGGKIWLSSQESKELLENSQNESERDSASAGIVEFSPIDLPSMDGEMRIDVPSLSIAYDYAFGSHDAAAFIRKRRLVESEEFGR